MDSTSAQTVTIDRISNAGNPLAQQQESGKTIHVPAGELGESYEVQLEDKGSHVVAHLVDRTTEIQPRSPSIDRGPDTSEIGRNITDPSRKSADSHSFTVRKSPAGGRLRSTPRQETARRRRHRMARRKH